MSSTLPVGTPSGESWNISFFSGVGGPDPFDYPARCVR